LLYDPGFYSRSRKENPLQEKTERWFELCRQAAVEQDPEKLLALIREINDLLEAKEMRLKRSATDA
jgi:hypothetical protein